MGGGWGAKHNEDGMNATVCLNDGDTHISPCEQVEAKYPVLFECHALRRDSGGPGRHRGGLGTEQVIQARSAITVNLRVDRVHCKPWGLAGGLDAMGNEAGLRIDGQDIDEESLCTNCALSVCALSMDYGIASHCHRGRVRGWVRMG